MEIFFGESVQSCSSKTVQFSLALTIVQAITSGAVDASLAPKYQVDNWNKSFSENLAIGSEPVHNSDAYLLFNKETDQAFIDAVNTALEELKADGTIKELSEEYLDGDYVPE